MHNMACQRWSRSVGAYSRPMTPSLWQSKPLPSCTGGIWTPAVLITTTPTESHPPPPAPQLYPTHLLGTVDFGPVLKQSNDYRLGQSGVLLQKLHHAVGQLWVVHAECLGLVQGDQDPQQKQLVLLFEWQGKAIDDAAGAGWGSHVCGRGRQGCHCTCVRKWCVGRVRVKEAWGSGVRSKTYLPRISSSSATPLWRSVS